MRRDKERLCARSWCAFLEWETARWGRVGVSVLDWVLLEDRLAAVVVDRFGETASKNPLR